MYNDHEDVSDLRFLLSNATPCQTKKEADSETNVRNSSKEEFDRTATDNAGIPGSFVFAAQLSKSLTKSK
jgi:hypothetical protein